MGLVLGRPQTSAVFSKDAVYRHVLTRRWGNRAGVTFIMLNPSTADATRDDATIRKCTRFAISWGYESLNVVNLFDYRSTDPSVLQDVERPSSNWNNKYITQTCLGTYRSGGVVVAAWGADKILKKRDRDKFVIRMLCNQYRVPIHCLELSKDDHPKHPLYLKSELRPVSWYA